MSANYIAVFKMIDLEKLKKLGECEKLPQFMAWYYPEYGVEAGVGMCRLCFANIIWAHGLSVPGAPFPVYYTINGFGLCVRD